ncbi:MAG: chemotaxis protein CheW [Gammaproteobacteria bacterium]|nr:chemotaxis protein CheW [Gammaproteobacteria bacterium]MCW8909215.1 chemotaxis protein CheW [Gammaproteobacteria bacterium]MCW9004148.1 chemotaxis protein CheW [Gammaproteobacteria bacterium]
MNDPFQRLQELEKLCIDRAAALPSLDSSVNEWVGIGFNIGDIELVSRMGEVIEILDLPKYTKIPGVKPWLIGIANVRGSLLPLMDLKGFINSDELVNKKNCRVLVVRHKGINTGLVVDGVSGLKYFSLEEQTYELPSIDLTLKPYIKQAFHREERDWPVFSFHTLIDDERFLQASL